MWIIDKYLIKFPNDKSLSIYIQRNWLEFMLHFLLFASKFEMPFDENNQLNSNENVLL